jgi:hypothetical protein
VLVGLCWLDAHALSASQIESIRTRISIVRNRQQQSSDRSSLWF